MSFTCSGTISGLLLGATTRTNRTLYPEVQLWRKSTNGTAVFTRQASQEIRLNPGDFSPDGVLQYNLTTPISYQSGDVLGVYQPRTINSTAILFYSTSNSTYNTYCIKTNLSPALVTLQSLTGKQILISPIITGEKLHIALNYALFISYTESSCSSNFPTRADLRRQILEVNINSVRERGRQQRLFPDITFTCNGSITKWIVGARHQPGRLRPPELQIWRRNVKSQSLQFIKTGFDLLEPNEIHPDVHEYIPNPPFEFQEGDILGLFQPNIKFSETVFYYQHHDGPINRVQQDRGFAIYRLGSIDFLDYDFPLISVEVSTSSTEGMQLL